MNPITEQLIEETYMFCYKRLNNPTDAEDLAQDIIYEAYKALQSGRKIYSFHSYYWKLAHNRYAAAINRKNNVPTQISLEYVSASYFSEDEPMVEKIISEEEINDMHFAISRMSKIHREVLIQYYLKGYKIEQIAENLDVPVGTIKRRLFDAKHSVQERIKSMPKHSFLSYAPSTLEIWHWGSLDFKFSIAELLIHQILVCCSHEAKTISDLSEELSVAPVYIEDKVAELLDARLMKETIKGKYITDFIIANKNTIISMLEDLDKEWAVLGRYMDKKIDELWDKICEIDFYGKHLGKKYLNWILFYMATGAYADGFGTHWEKSPRFHFSSKTELTSRFRDSIVNSDYDKPYRIMGQVLYADDNLNPYEVHSVFWSCHWQKFETVYDGNFTYANLFAELPFDKKRNHMVNGFNVALLAKLAENPNTELCEKEEEVLAAFIDNGIVKKEDNGYYPQLMIISHENYSKLYLLLKDAFDDIAKHFVSIIPPILDKYLLSEVRADLLEQYYNYVTKIFIKPTTHMLWYGMHNGSIEIPSDYSKSSAGLLLISEKDRKWAE